MLHARELAFGAGGIRVAEIVGDYETKNGIAEKLERLIVQFTSLEFVTRGNFLVSPRTMSDGPFEQSTILKVVRENRFEEIQVGSRFGIFQSALDYNKRRKLVEKCDLLPALGG
jgi:hypothetical protein